MLGLSMGFILGGLLAVASLAIVIFLAIWTYRDAESKGMMPVLWTALVVIVPSFIGLIIYLVVRTDNNKITCANCNKRVNSNMKFCSNCGMELKQADIDIDKQEEFNNTQKKLLTGIFVSIGITIICGVMMIVSFIIGGMQIARKVVDYTSNIDVKEITEDVTDALTDLDKAFGDEDFNVNVDDDVIKITNDDGEEILRVDGDSADVNINGKELKKYIRDIGGDEEISDEDIKRVEDKINKAIKENSDAHEDIKKVEDEMNEELKENSNAHDDVRDDVRDDVHDDDHDDVDDKFED